MPLLFLFQWINALLSVAIVGGGAYTIYRWYTERQEVMEQLARLGRLEAFRWTDGIEPLIFGVVLLVIAILGRPLVLLFLGRSGTDDPKPTHDGEIHKIKTPDGTDLHVEVYGPKEGTPIIMTHGWGLDSTAWYYAKKELANRYRLIMWDLPGLGHSSSPPDKDWNLEKLAGYLSLLLPLAGDKPVFLLGHSIGGMTTQTFCRLFPEALRNRVQGLILVDTTYINPARTSYLHGFLHAIEGPILKPLMYLTIALWPLMWLMNWLSYFNGTLHLATAYTGFDGTQTRGQLDFMTRFTPVASPEVQARGCLAAMKFDERTTLPTIPVPALVIVADTDRVTVPETGATIANLIPSTELVTLAPANHSSFIEQHERFAEVVSQFVEKHRMNNYTPVPQ